MLTVMADTCCTVEERERKRKVRDHYERTRLRNHENDCTHEDKKSSMPCYGPCGACMQTGAAAGMFLYTCGLRPDPVMHKLTKLGRNHGTGV